MKKKDIFCPICNKPHTWTDENKFRPFCSDRCKLIDLGEWADDSRSVPGETIPNESENSDDQQ